MKLYGSPLSPYVRKIRVQALESGLDLPFESVAPTPLSPAEAVSSRNPLGKVPLLELDDGSCLYDSRVIAEYLASLNPAAELLPSGPARWDVLRRQALADGMLDSGVAVRYEVAFRPAELHWQPWLQAQAAKVLAALDQFETEAEGFGETVDLGTIAIASAMGWLLFRKVTDYSAEGPVDLAARCPRLWAWYQAFEQRPSMQATHPALG